MEESTTETTSDRPQRTKRPAIAPTVLTHSALNAYLRCPSEYQWAYEAMMTPREYPSALAVGSAVHAGVEQLHRGGSLDGALVAAMATVDHYAGRANPANDEEAERLAQQVGRDRAMARALLRGWFDRWYVPWNGSGTHRDRELEILDIEVSLEAPLVNPDTMRRSRTFRLAGKLDGIVVPRGNEGEDPHAPLVYELKTSGEDPDEFEAMMRRSWQPALYRYLAGWNRSGDISGTVLDVIHKPTVRLRKDETHEALELRVTEMLRNEPERYFRRRVIPANPELEREALRQTWAVSRAIRESHRYGYLKKSGTACRGAFGRSCAYRALCWDGDGRGFNTKSTPHEELVE